MPALGETSHLWLVMVEDVNPFAQRAFNAAVADSRHTRGAPLTMNGDAFAR